MLFGCHVGKRVQAGELFDDATIATIFGNGSVEKIAAMHESYLDSLTKGGEAAVCTSFLERREGFKLYGFYCGNHPKASAAYEELKQSDFQIQSFFEGATLLAGKQVEPLILKPIQRICQYPMLFGELIRKTWKSHPDYKNVAEALEVAQPDGLTLTTDH